MNSRRWGVLRAILEAGYHRTKLRKNLECVTAAWIYGEQWSLPTTPFGSPEKTGQRADFGPWVIQSNARPSAIHIAQGKMRMETWFHFRGPDFFRLGPWMLVSACQYISLVDAAINEGKSRGSSESKKGVTTWPEEDDQGTEHPRALRNLLPLLNSKPFELARRRCVN